MKKRILAAIAALISISMVLAGCGSISISLGTTASRQETANADAASESETEAGKEEKTDSEKTETSEETETNEETEDSNKTLSSEMSDYFSDRDLEGTFDEDEAVSITLNGSSASCKNTSAVSISGTEVTIKEEGVYIVSGTLNDGMIIVDADDSAKVQIVLDGADITSKTSAAIYALSADKVFLTMSEGSQNSLANGGSFEAIDDNNIDAVIFSKCDLTINGEGSLDIESPAGHGIVTKDDLVITQAAISIDCESSGINGKDSVRIADGTISVVAGSDGIKSTYGADDDEEASEDKGYVVIFDGDISIDAGDDGIHAESGISVFGGNIAIESADDAIHGNGNVTISGGTFEITAGDDGMHSGETLTIADGTIDIAQSYEGLEGSIVQIDGGNITLTSSDDGINAAGGTDSSGMGRGGWFGGMDMFGGSDGSYGINITGGTVYVNAGGDGLDSNGSLTISGGELIVDGPTSDGDSALDSQSGSTISGGTLISVGSSGMAEGFSATGSQGYILYICGSQSAGTEVSLYDSEGNEIASHTSAKAFACVEISCAEIVSGGTYTLKIGSSEYEITMDSLTYSSGGMGGMGNMGNKGGMGNMGGRQGGGTMPGGR